MFRVLKRYLSLRRQERHAIAVLVALLMLVLGLQLYLRQEEPWTPLAITLPAYTPPPPHATNERTTAAARKPLELFFFDPNTIRADDARRLGFPEKTTHILMHYREKGGRFRQAEDLQRLYGVSPQLYERLRPYVRIAFRDTGLSRAKSAPLAAQIPLPSRKKEITLLELNQADSLALVALRGIGPALSRRILRYREALGGFYTLEQLSEVYGLRDSLIQLLAPQLRVDSSQIRKIQMNTVSLETLRRHPYFSWRGAEAWIRYRNKHSGLNWSDLESLGIFTGEQLRRLKPYLVF